MTPAEAKLLAHWRFMTQPGATVPEWCDTCKEIGARILRIFGIRYRK